MRYSFRQDTGDFFGTGIIVVSFSTLPGMLTGPRSLAWVNPRKGLPYVGWRQTERLVVVRCGQFFVLVCHSTFQTVSNSG